MVSKDISEQSTDTKGQDTKSIIKSALDEVSKFAQSCNIYEFAREVNHVSGYLQYQLGREIITEKEFYNYKWNLSDKIKMVRDHCECTIKNK